MRMKFSWRSAVKPLAIAAAIGMYLVYVLGTIVTNTNSGQGCGRTWPLCRGKFIPEFAITTAIEYVHRVATGIEGLLIIAVAILALLYWRQRREIQILVPAMVVFLLIEAVLGGIVAQSPRQPVVLAFHFGSSLLLLVSVVLTAVVVYEANGGTDAVRDRPMPRWFIAAVWALFALTYVAGYLGAYVEHTGIGLACSQWPTCRSVELLPPLVGATGASITLNLLHRSLALLLALGTFALYWRARQLRRGRPDLYRASVAAL